MTQAELTAVDKIFLKKLDEMPSIVEGFTELSTTLAVTVAEKKKSRVLRAEKQKSREKSQALRIPIIEASNVTGEQGGESPLGTQPKTVSSPNSFNTMFRIRFSKQ